VYIVLNKKNASIVMINIYENISDTWFSSIREAGQYYGVLPNKIKDNLGYEFKVKGTSVLFSETPLPPPDKFKSFVKEKGLKHMIGSFYLNKDKEVWMWAKKKQEWYRWNTIKFDNGNIAFKTKLKYQGMFVDKWVNVNQYHKGIFGEVKEVEAPF